MSTGSKILQAAETKIGQQYILGASVPLNSPGWDGPWDCAELCSWALFQVSGVMYGTMNENYTIRNAGDPATADAYTGFWDHDSRNSGQRISIQEAGSVAGAMLLRAPTSSRGGHIAISDGNGGTVEAKGAAWGVVRDRISGRGWDTGVLVPGIHYGEASEEIDYQPAEQWLQITSPYTSGEEVERIQRRLLAFGYSPGPIDGVFGSKTQAAIITFQAQQGITVDGVVGKDTLALLFPDVVADDAGEVVEIDEAADWSCSEGWRITGYYTPDQSDYPPVDMRSVKVAGNDYSFPDKFIDAVRMEGWGKTDSGWYIGYYSSRYHRESEPKDSKGRKLEEGAVAVDPRLIPRGTQLQIHGVPTIEGRIFTAKDVGGAILDRKVDVYCGEGNAARLRTYSVTKDGTQVCILG